MWEEFQEFWSVRKPNWTGTDMELIENILTDPDFTNLFIPYI